MPDQVTTTTQVSFAGGLNAVQSPHNLAQDEVQSSTNVDYSLQWGAAQVRRGSLQYGTVSGVSGAGSLNLTAITRNYGLSSGTWTDSLIPWYAGDDLGNLYVGSGTSTPIQLNSFGSNGGTAPQLIPQFTQYEGYVYAADGTSAVKTNGSVTWPWIYSTPPTPTVQVQQQFAVGLPFVGFPGSNPGGSVDTYVAQEGTITASSTTTIFGTTAIYPYNSVIINTCTTGTGSRVVLVGGTLSNPSWHNPIEFVTLPTGYTVSTVGPLLFYVGGNVDPHQGWPSGDTTGASGSWSGTSTVTATYTIGDYGTDYLLLGLPNQQNVVNIQLDLSVGDNTFANYWHAEGTPDAILDATINPISALLSAQGNGTIEDQNSALNQSRGYLSNPSGTPGANLLPIHKRASKQCTARTISPWAIARSSYTFVGVIPTPTFNNIQGVRVTVEFNTTGQQVLIGGIATYGGQAYCLNDQSAGLSYYQTYARVENGVIVAEGAASIATTPVRATDAAVKISINPSLSVPAGVTHNVFYRSGGLLGDAYRIGSCSIGSGTGAVEDWIYSWSQGGSNITTTNTTYGEKIVVGSSNIVVTALGRLQDFSTTTHTGWISTGTGSTVVASAILSPTVNTLPWAWAPTLATLTASGTYYVTWMENSTDAIGLVGSNTTGTPVPVFASNSDLHFIANVLGTSVSSSAAPANFSTNTTTGGGWVGVSNLQYEPPGSVAIYDYALPDMLVINNPSLRRFLWSQWPSPSAGTGLPGVNSVSLPWQNRVWVGVGNQLYWSYPGVPGQIQDNSQTTVADSGDNISAIIPAQNLVIVNQNSVFEMAGSIFEGTAQNWSLTRTQASRGCAAPKTAISTPYGILLFGYSGLSFYRQGWGIDQDLPWVQEKIGDLWKGTAGTDPAQQKGRMPAINLQAIWNACAAYKDERVYLAVPTGANSVCDTLFVLDIPHQKVWMFTYPFKITSLFWDRVGNRLMAGTTNGTIQQIETGLLDSLPTGATEGVAWSFTTREWSTPVDTLWENLQVENVGTATWIADADNTNTYTLATTTQMSKGWTPVSLQGTTGDNLNFIFRGTQSGSSQFITAIEWDSIPKAKKVTFFETSPTAIPSENYVKTWLADLNVLTGTATGSLLVDGTVVQTASFISGPTGPDSAQRKVYEVGLPNVTYGKNIVAIYNSTSPFRHYNTSYELEAKPFGKSTWLVTYKKAGGASQADMARFYAMDLEGTETMTVTNTWIIDGSVFSTNTLVFSSSSDSGEEGSRVRNYMDQIPFPPGGRGYLFQQQMTASTPFKVWRASLDFDRIGVKGLSRVTQNGSPSPGSA